MSVATTGSTAAGRPHERKRFRTSGDTVDAKEELFIRKIEQTQFTEPYWAHCGLVDRHNHLRHSGLDLETILGTHNWIARLWTTFFAFSIVDAFLLHAFVHKTDPDEHAETLSVFIGQLSYMLIHNEELPQELDQPADAKFMQSHGLVAMPKKVVAVSLHFCSELGRGGRSAVSVSKKQVFIVEHAAPRRLNSLLLSVDHLAIATRSI